MSEGNVKWFNPRKGYGFIANKDGPDIFVHYASISGEGYKTLVEGDEVSFDIVEGEKGLRAENVVPKSSSKSQATPAAKSKAVSKSKITSKDEAAPEDEAALEDEAAPEDEVAPEDKAAPESEAASEKE